MQRHLGFSSQTLNLRLFYSSSNIRKLMKRSWHWFSELKLEEVMISFSVYVLLVFSIYTFHYIKHVCTLYVFNNRHFICIQNILHLHSIYTHTYIHTHIHIFHLYSYSTYKAKQFIKSSLVAWNLESLEN